MIKNKQEIKHYICCIQFSLDMMSELEPDNHIVQNVVRSGFDLIQVLAEEIDK